MTDKEKLMRLVGFMEALRSNVQFLNNMANSTKTAMDAILLEVKK